jgi:hypothetical protein
MTGRTIRAAYLGAPVSKVTVSQHGKKDTPMKNVAHQMKIATVSVFDGILREGASRLHQ